MKTKSILSMLALSAVIMTFGTNEAGAGFPLPPGFPAPPGVNIRVDGYLPAPPGVQVRIDAGRPYYIERDRRVYVEREPARHYKKKHYKKEKKHHHNRGHGNGRGRY